MNQSQTANYLEEAALFNNVPLAEKYNFPAPDNEECSNAIAEMMAIVSAVFADTCLENDVQEILWQMVNIYHRKIQGLDRELDTNVVQQQALQTEQDGSEIKSVELETILGRGEQIQVRLQTIETMRDIAAKQFLAETGSVWLPKSGSIKKQQTMTGSLIDSREFANACKLQKTEQLIPQGTKIAVSGGKQCDYKLVWAQLDACHKKLNARGEALVLLHGGGEGVEKSASLWAKNNNVEQVIFRPDWNRYGKAAPFKRNDAILNIAPKGLMVLYPDSGIHEQIIREAKRIGIKHKIVR